MCFRKNDKKPCQSKTITACKQFVCEKYFKNMREKLFDSNVIIIGILWYKQN